MSAPESPRRAASPRTEKDWHRIEQLFHDACERPPDQRSAFLAQACDGDSSLQREVESLLGQVDGPLFDDGVQTLARQVTRASRSGTRLGPYVLGPLIGEGGMGEVYRARDSRLDRDVAIKLLHADLAHDPERLRRSEREARVLASLNHPNIAALYGVEEENGLTGLVLELVPGVTLQQHLATRGALALDEALAIARQIASALEAAHQHGVVHRDLKPTNVTITPDGLVKVLDFGLARIDATEPEAAETAPLVTGAGRILGTPAYMSPEQARGKAADRRSDIWAFGAVLFEMLTGQRVFQGESVADTLSAVIHDDARLDRLPSSTPWHVRATINRCLQKDARDRARDMADVRMALDGAFSDPAPAVAATSTATSRDSRSSSSAPWLAAAALVGALLAGAAVWLLKAPSPGISPSMRFRVSAPEGFKLNRFALSPDGRSVAFTAESGTNSGLWVHSFETGQSRHLERAGRVTGFVFWSPDGKFIGFPAWGALHRIAVDGTAPTRITAIDGYGGAQWTSDGTLLYGSPRGGLLKIPPSGGAPVAVTALDAAREETGHIAPSMLPDGRRFLYYRTSRNPDLNAVFVGSLDAAPSAQSTRPVFTVPTLPLLSRSRDGAAHLLFVRDGTLMAQALDTSSMMPSGAAFAVVENVAPNQLSVAGDTIAIRGSGTPAGGVPTWFERDGRHSSPAFAPSPPVVQFPQISPDGTRLAATVGPSLWVYPLDGRPPVRLTSGNSLSPRWSPDGQSIVYERFGAIEGLHTIAADGSDSVPRALGPTGHLHAFGFLTGGRALLAALEPTGTVGPWPLMQVPTSGTEPPARLGDIALEDGSNSAALSPDGRWLAYIANTTGRAELWVRPFPMLDAAVRISPNGAAEPVWARDGRELFYIEGDKLMRVRVGADTATRFNYEAPKMLLEKSFVRVGQPPSFDVAADGRLLMLAPAPTAPSAPIDVIVNWRERSASRTAP